MLGHNDIYVAIFRPNGEKFREFETDENPVEAKSDSGRVKRKDSVFAIGTTIAVQATEQYYIEVGFPQAIFSKYQANGGAQISVTIDGNFEARTYGLHFSRFVPYAELLPQGSSATMKKRFILKECAVRSETVTDTSKAVETFHNTVFKFADLQPDPAFQPHHTLETEQMNFIGRIEVDVQLGTAKEGAATQRMFGVADQRAAFWGIHPNHLYTTQSNHNKGLQYYTRLDRTRILDEVPTSGHMFTALYSSKGVKNRFIFYVRDMNYITRPRLGSIDSLHSGSKADDHPAVVAASLRPRPGPGANGVDENISSEEEYYDNWSEKAVPREPSTTHIANNKRKDDSRQQFVREGVDSDADENDVGGFIPTVEAGEEDPLIHLSKRLKSTSLPPDEERTSHGHGTVTRSHKNLQLRNSALNMRSGIASKHRSRGKLRSVPAKQAFGRLENITEEATMPQQLAQERRINNQFHEAPIVTRSEALIRASDKALTAARGSVMYQQTAQPSQKNGSVHNAAVTSHSRDLVRGSIGSFGAHQLFSQQAASDGLHLELTKEELQDADFVALALKSSELASASVKAVAQRERLQIQGRLSSELALEMIDNEEELMENNIQRRKVELELALKRIERSKKADAENTG